MAARWSCDSSDEEILTSRKKRYQNTTEILESVNSTSAHRLLMQSAVIAYSCMRDSHPKSEGFQEIKNEDTNLEFFRECRLTRATFNKIMEDLSAHEPFTTYNVKGREQLDLEKALMVTLWYLGRQSTYYEISKVFGISPSCCHTYVSTIIAAINDVYKRVIKWPGMSEITKVEEEFRQLGSFPGCIGAIDGCHIRIRAPEESQKCYLDRTMNHSVNLLAVCDANLKFTYIFAGFPGSAHDQRVLANSPLGLALENDMASLCYSNSYHIIGDSAFTLKPYMMVPYKDNGYLNAKQLNYNTKLSKSRRVIENAFAWLKGRFRRLKYIEADLHRIQGVIQAACILHNITIESSFENELIESEITDEPEDHDNQGRDMYEESGIAEIKRKQISDSLPF
ncbi:UNVERIFIED_CONTAM: hypothetical protein RMT77_016972 [Armadillidium vulgare]